MDKVVLGIDPGTRITGYGLVSLKGTALTYVHSGTIVMDEDAPLSVRLNVIFETLSHLVQTYHPTDLAVESVFYSKNVQSVVTLSHARAIALLVAARFQLTTGEYSPLEVKRAVAGYGNATKQQLSKMVERLFPSFKNQTSFDQTDALAIAVCHSQVAKTRSHIAKALEKKAASMVRIKE